MGWAARANYGASPVGKMTRKLRRLAQSIVTRTEFERILREAPHPEHVRRLLEPMLDPNLPCCAIYTLGGTGHATSCPTQKLVITG